MKFRFGYITGFKMDRCFGHKKFNKIKGIRELITKNIIARHKVNHIYWLNPTIVCKGERFAKYVEYVVGTPEEIEKSEALLKKQANNVFSKLPTTIENKIDKANEQGTFIFD